MNEIAIEVSDLTKKYNLYSKHSDVIKEMFNPFKKSYHTEFYALNKVSFKIKKGETIGILGENGAGKSTLLKMITGVLTQTSGTIKTQGKIASLLELGAGFNHNLSGYENIYLNGAIMGLTNSEIEKKVDKILEFADIGEFIHQSVKSYSSGMFARLAFATAINVDPDILIVDEALSVGDIAFQAKCFAKFREFQEQNKTILFVTHSVDLIIKYCQSAIILDHGKLIMHADTKTAVETYRKYMVNTSSSDDTCISHQDHTQPVVTSTKESLLKESLKLSEHVNEYGTKEAQIIDFAILNEDKKVTNLLVHGEVYSIYLKVKFYQEVSEPIFAFTLRSVEGLELTGTNSMNLGKSFSKIKQGSVVTVTFKQKMILNSAQYLLALGCTKIDGTSLKIFHRLYDAVVLEVISHERATGIAFDKSELDYEIAE